MTIGETIRTFREQRGMTQAQLAEKCRMKRTQIGTYERDQHVPGVLAFDELATKGLGVKLSEVIKLWEGGE